MGTGILNLWSLLGYELDEHGDAVPIDHGSSTDDLHPAELRATKAEAQAAAARAEAQKLREHLEEMKRKAKGELEGEEGEGGRQGEGEGGVEGQGGHGRRSDEANAGIPGTVEPALNGSAGGEFGAFLLKAQLPQYEDSFRGHGIRGRGIDGITELGHMSDEGLGLCGLNKIEIARLRRHVTATISVPTGTTRTTPSSQDHRVHTHTLAEMQQVDQRIHTRSLGEAPATAGQVLASRGANGGKVDGVEKKKEDDEKKEEEEVDGHWGVPIPFVIESLGIEATEVWGLTDLIDDLTGTHSSHGFNENDSVKIGFMHLGAEELLSSQPKDKHGVVHEGVWLNELVMQKILPKVEGYAGKQLKVSRRPPDNPRPQQCDLGFGHGLKSNLALA